MPSPVRHTSLRIPGTRHICGIPRSPSTICPNNTSPGGVSLVIATPMFPIGDEPAGIASYTLTDPANLGWNFAQYGLPNTAAGLGGNLGALQQGDGRTPYTERYDFIVSQALPWRSILEV